MSDIGPRERMIRGAAALLSERGLQGTSFSEVIEYTGAARGSIYHHFPGGKDELILEALRHVGTISLRPLRGAAARPAVEVVGDFAAMWRQLLVGTDLRSGCSVAAVTIASDSMELLDVAAEVFGSWRHALASVLEAGGAPAGGAQRTAIMIVSALEGALILTRAERDIAIFDSVAESLVALVGVAVE